MVDNRAAAQVLVSPEMVTVFVGVRHGATFTAPATVATYIRQVGNKVGFWYEGGGGDKAKIEQRLGPIKWAGSWDDFVKSDSSDFYYALFSNSKEGTAALVDRVADPAETILQALDNAGHRIAHEALHGKTTPAKLADFLRKCGSGLLTTAEKTPATRAALLAFIRRGEALMWPFNWRSSPNAASRVANRANELRLEAILDRAGVFFLGRDHITTLQDMSPSLRPFKVGGA
jgi:hypothetical protein